jgi:hypothetical protein
MIVQLHDDLVAIYTLIRDRYQKKIDEVFDKVSRQVGYVVTTTIPVAFEVGKNNRVLNVTLGAKHLNKTLFERELSTTMKKMKNDPLPSKVTAGSYSIYLIWHEALKLKFRTEWMEPAHFFRPKPPILVKPEVMEPAHWFDIKVDFAVDEKVIVTVLDEVYPDLKLIDRMVNYRRELYPPVSPDVKEPAHYRRQDFVLPREQTHDVLRELASVLRRYGY